jgi:protein SCO1/2
MRKLLLIPLLAALALVIAALALAACRKAPPSQPQSSHFKVYHLRGKVVSTDAAKGEVTLDHEAIPGFMEAMTMPYKLKDPSVLPELHPGDVITADVLVSQDADADLLLDHIVVVAQARPDYKPAVSYHVPTPGDQTPDFKLRNQDGRAIHLGQFRGQALLITFIYTRCPRPDFCPLVTRHFAAIDEQLRSDARLGAKTHLVSISFDPDNDTSARLRAFALEYMKEDRKDAFARWDFAVPEKGTLPEMAKFFDLAVSAGDGNTLTHTLSTTLIGPDGKVVRFYPGNDWTPDQVLADLRQIPAFHG